MKKTLLTIGIYGLFALFATSIFAAVASTKPGCASGTTIPYRPVSTIPQAR